MRTTRNTTLALALALATAACADDLPAPDTDGGADGGTMIDAGPRTPDSSTPSACDAARAITLTEGAQTITGDTTGASSSLTLGDGCGEAPAPQEVLAITLPGSGDVGVKFSLVDDATEFDTVVELRPADCEETIESICDDEVSLFEVRSAGSFIAEGGSTVYLVVSGYDADAFGGWSMDVTTIVNPEAPVLTGGEAVLVGGTRLELSLAGSDVEGDVMDFGLSYLDAAGAVIPVDVDSDPATPPEPELFFGFAEDLAGMTTFTGTARVTGGELADAATIASVRIKLYDELLLESAPMDFPIVRVTESAFGEACAEGVSRCEIALECVSAVCALPAATVTACEAATPLTLTPGTDMILSATIAAGDGAVSATCGETGGDEALYTVAIPSEGIFDLIATTVRDANDSAMVDTVLYAPTRCGDPATERPSSCSDDVIEEEDYRSTLELQAVTAGATYTIGLELWGGVTADTTLELAVRLRPVLGAGESCDLTAIANRCSTGPCAGAPAVCPGTP